MKVLRAVMLASVCAVAAAGSTSAPLLDVERTDTNVIIVETPANRSINVTERSATTITTTLLAEVTEMTPTTDVQPAGAQDSPLEEVTEMTPTTDVQPAGAQDLPVDVGAGALPSP